MSLYAPIDLLDEDSADAASPRSAFGRTVLTLLVILACICAGTALAFKSGAPDRDSTANITISNASEDALYQTIAEESVPGLKLARMQDFLAQYPHSARRGAAHPARQAISGPRPDL